MKYFSNGGVGLEIKWGGGIYPSPILIYIFSYVIVYLFVLALCVCVCDIK